MKKFAILISVLVLTVAVFTGCGCRNTQPMNTTAPTTRPTTMPTEQTTTPTTAATTQETIEDGNGPLPTNATAGADGDTSSATDDTGMGENSRSMPGGKSSGNGTGGSGMGGNGMGGSGMGGSGMGGSGTGSSGSNSEK